MIIDFYDIVFPEADYEYGFGDYGLGIYFYSTFLKILLFIPDKNND